MLFELEDIEQLATVSSFTRGKSYYENDYVKNISRSGNTFKGLVFGSYKYDVSLKVNNGELYFTCNCPYDYGGICKHSVALALAILNDEYVDKIELSTTAKTDSTTFKNHYNAIENKVKLNFLKQLLEKDTDLQSQFMAFTRSKSKNLNDIAEIDMEKIRKDFCKKLETIDFDFIVENYSPYADGYYDEEGYIDEADEEIRKVIRSFSQKAIGFIQKGNLLDGIRIVLGMYEGSQNLSDPEDNEYEIFYGSYSNVVMEMLSKELENIVTKIEMLIKTEENARSALDIIIQRSNYYKKLNFQIEGKVKDEKENNSIVYNLKFLEKLIISLLISKKTAEYFYRVIKENDLENLSLALVLLKIATLKKDEKLWFRYAESFAGFEQNIAKQLLEKYQEQNRKNNFNRIAKLVHKNWPDEFDFYLMNNLDKVSEKELYIKALKNYTNRKQSVKYYKELREYLNENQRKAFIEKTPNWGDYMFYVRLLEIEEHYNDILILAEKKLHIDYNFEKIVKPIANIYPDKCFEMIKTKCNAAMTSHKRKRKTYQHMVKWLQVMEKIKSKKGEAEIYIRSLYNHKPNLPALKEEFRHALKTKLNT